MITNKELNEVTLSATKKDYYQIWNELMDLAGKISDRWSPASTNESDPGIVLLKALTAIADKLNYNIDKNTLEAFMPSATQEDSMRKLTEMMGYDMKHYMSATGKAVISYKLSNDVPIKDFGWGIYFPKFVNLKNEDETINYITLEEFTLQDGDDSREIAIMEGELIECETNNDNIVTALHLDDSNRYILPEYAIAENGIFITNIKDSDESELWRKEQNLNVQQPGTKVYKVGFDSALQLPYIQFPSDIRTIIEDGLKIKYVRTNGLNGGISARVLSKMEKPAIWATAEDDDPVKELLPDNFAVTNNSATSNGADPESLDEAYNNYKKTIGTFETLVTCRDYMNKIYQLTESDTNPTPLVSNIIVSDIRDDINRSTPVCTFNEYGICYEDVSLREPVTIHNVTLTDNESGTSYTGTLEATQDKIDHFDLIFYPFKPVYGLNTKNEYRNSFKYSAENVEKIKADLATCKTIAHNVVTHDSSSDSELACIKNYLKLKARVTTTKKVTTIEEAEILNNIYKAIYKNFNMRQIDFGEEIPYEQILQVLKAADYRIKEINLEEPLLSTKFCRVNGTEVDLPPSERSGAENHAVGNAIYNKLALRNVLGGKIAAFDYEKEFLAEYDKVRYPDAPNLNEVTIASLTSEFNVAEAWRTRNTGLAPEVSKEPEQEDTARLRLKENEVIQFRLPNFKTIKTYPAYVNYFLKLTGGSGTPAVPAVAKTLYDYLGDPTTAEGKTNWEGLVNSSEPDLSTKVVTANGIDTAEKFSVLQRDQVAVFTKSGSTYTLAESFSASPIPTYYYLPINDNCFHRFDTWIKTKQGEGDYRGIYKSVGVQEKPEGLLIDSDLIKYMQASAFGPVVNNSTVLKGFYVIETPGEDASYSGVPKNGEYQLQDNEYLLINYTDSKTDESGTERKTVINKIYETGKIIRANFELTDSTIYNSAGHSFSKRDGFVFGGLQPKGMFTLGTSEQIEIRELVKVELNDDVTYLYWTLNSDDPLKESNEFIFDEDYGINPTDRTDAKGNTWEETVDGVLIPKHNAYTLKEGEYLYYTNSKKQDLVYYGAGTLIVRGINTPDLFKYATNGEASEEDIMTYGLAAEIPWHSYKLSGGESYQLTIREHQYITLTEGDSLISLNGDVPGDRDGGKTWNDWVELTGAGDNGAQYRFAEDETTTPIPTIAVDALQWEVRSRLDFNMSKTTAQPLYPGDSIVVNKGKDDAQTIGFTAADTTAYVNSGPIYVNSNYACTVATDTLNFDTSENVDETRELKLKISSLDIPRIAGGDGRPSSAMALNNYINGDAKYTKFNFASLPKDYQVPALEDGWGSTVGKPLNPPEPGPTYHPAFTLNTDIPTADATKQEVSFGLIMLYYLENLDQDSVEETTLEQRARIVATTSTGENEAGLTLFNSTDYGVVDEVEVGESTDGSWAGAETTCKWKESPVSTLILRPGINIVKVTSGVSHLKFYPDVYKQGTVIFGGLDIVKGHGVNPKLDYRAVEVSGDNGRFYQLLKDLRDSAITEDEENGSYYYYNIPIQRSDEIDLNEAIEEDKLSSPLAWYDLNNVNRKFVISEIDADYLSTGITLTKTSRA